VLSNHRNALMYDKLARLVDFSGGYFLESEPCLVCNDPEVAFSSIKLSSLKVDVKHTTSTQIVKLSGSHAISKINLRIGDLKRQKMVRTINIYYNNRNVQAVVELKNRPALWHKAKRVALTAGQTDVKVDFPLPIVACNLMLEYADFFDVHTSSETLQCPRCSATVPANPGVCANCGENVFQCHKCRSINYDEKDPFLCNICGFCKYAKFDYALTCRPCCAVDPVENEEDRKKATNSLQALLDKADRVYALLAEQKPHLESLLAKIGGGGGDEVDPQASAPAAGSGGANPGVNRHIQELAQRYCGAVKENFQELSQVIQKLLATRKELVKFDESVLGHQGQETASTSCPSNGDEGDVVHSRTTCYGCATAAVGHCLTLLRAMAGGRASRQLLFEKNLISELLEHNLRRGPVAIRAEVRKLICLLIKDNLEATRFLCDQV